MHGTFDRLPRGPRRLAFFCPDVTEASTLTRAGQFIDHGYDVTVFGFRRERYNMSYRPEWPHVALGMTADGKYWQRLRALVGALPAIFANRATLKRATVFYARNIDQLLLALLARLLVFSRAPVAYEVLDIPPILIQRGPAARALRLLERICLRRIRVLVLSSPGFHRSYYAAIQKYDGTWFLLENKLHAAVTQLAARAPSADGHVESGRNRPWVIGYFGLIRGEETFALMTRLADRLKDRIVFRFRGVLTTVDEANFKATLESRGNMVYGGPYRPYRDLEELYRGVDFAWALDLEHVDHNSRWLLPCRFYEAGYFGVPCLAVHGFEVGSLVERHRIGWTFDTPLEDRLAAFFESITPDDYDRIRCRLRTMPRSMFVADDDVARLSKILDR
ncbi:MAG: hypothetical protein JSR47_18800 [Proteobacteria bacterium]|nr:hypothetical protein [Pseudomonadota bacterium]